MKRFAIFAALAFLATPATAHRCRSTITGRFIKCPVPIPTPPPPPPIPTPSPAKGTALALQACAAINRNESVIVGRTYNVVEFGHDVNGGEFAVLSDASHLGDGYFSLYVSAVCLQIGT